MTRRKAPAPALLVGVAMLIAAAAVIALLGGHAHRASHSSERRPGAVAATQPDYGPPALATYIERAPHVTSTLLPYALQGAVRGAGAVPASSLPPVTVGEFRAPIDADRRFAEARLAHMSGAIAGLERSLSAGDRAAAKNAWREAFADYLGLGAVYLDPGPAARLNELIDGTPGGLSGGASSPHFSGLHRLERGLWTTTPLAQVTPWAQHLAADVRRLRRTLPSVSISPLQYATRAHEILEDAVRDLLSGTDVPWSGEGLLGTEAGLEATTEIVRTLAALLRPREGVLGAVDGDLARLRSTFASIRRSHGGQLPTNAEMTRLESERLDGSLGQALEGLAQIPGALETAPLPTIPRIAVSPGR